METTNTFTRPLDPDFSSYSEQQKADYEAFKDDVLHLRGFGETPETICERLGVSLSTAARRCYRYGDTDLGKMFAKHVTRAYRVNEPEDLVSAVERDLMTYTPSQVCFRYSKSLRNMVTLMREAGRKDLAKPFRSEYERRLRRAKRSKH